MGGLVILPVVHVDGMKSRVFAHAITRHAFNTLCRWLWLVDLVGAQSSSERLAAVVQAGRLPWVQMEGKGAGSTEATATAIAKRWMDALAAYPDWVIIRAFKTYDIKGKFPPKIADIAELCERLWPHAKLAEKVRSIIERVAAVHPDWKE